MSQTKRNTSAVLKIGFALWTVAMALVGAVTLARQKDSR